MEKELENIVKNTQISFDGGQSFRNIGEDEAIPTPEFLTENGQILEGLNGYIKWNDIVMSVQKGEILAFLTEGGIPATAEQINSFLKHWKQFEQDPSIKDVYFKAENSTQFAEFSTTPFGQEENFPYFNFTEDLDTEKLFTGSGIVVKLGAVKFEVVNDGNGTSMKILPKEPN